MTDLNREKFISRGAERLMVCCLLLLGFAVRLAFLGSLPLGLNQDEASAGYDAWALLNYGMDRCGNFWPVLLTAWGSGQNALLSYLAIPFVASLGLTPLAVRLPMAIVNCAALVVFWLLARRVRGPRFALTALLFLAVNPWHIMASRWALESNLLPAFLLAGVYFTLLAKGPGRQEQSPCPTGGNPGRSWFLLPAAVCFALSLYAYGTAYFFLPFFLVFAVVWLRRDLRPLSFCVSFAAFILIALPISLCQLRNALGLPGTDFLGLTLPALTESRQFTTTVFGGGGMGAVAENLSSALGLLLRQTDGLIFNSLDLWKGGLIYFFGLPLALAGIVISLAGKRGAPGEAPVMAALLCCIPAIFLVQGNVNRLNMLWLPLIYFAALGLHALLCFLQKWGMIVLAGLALVFVLFTGAYIDEFGGRGNVNFFPGLGDCVEYVEEREPESVFISYYVNQPYIFALFYSETPVENFVETVDYVNPDGAFRWVRSFGRYRFGRAESAEGEYLILHRSERGDRPALAAYGEYVVCFGKT